MVRDGGFNMRKVSRRIMELKAQIEEAQAEVLFEQKAEFKDVGEEIDISIPGGIERYAKFEKAKKKIFENLTEDRRRLTAKYNVDGNTYEIETG
jgi:hypothetical protein